MPDAPPTNSPIVSAYRQNTAESFRLWRDARNVFPGGIVHDSRHMAPYPIYVARAQGSRKWDVDGNEYIDYYGGHGSLILGHAHPSFLAAVAGQAALGSHFAACHTLELEWGRLVQRMVPSAERVRFTASGTEANLMAIRLARAFTGRTKLMRLKNHFHGWQDHVAFGSKFQAAGEAVPGILKGIIDAVIVVDPGDSGAVRQLLESTDDVAAVILEPTGASSGQMPLRREFAAMLRDVTSRRGIVLIFDEVVTGFRVSPGGAQAAWGILPDLTSLAKILSGGLPGGAVVGRKDILDLLDFEEAVSRGFKKIPHQGTFNANPVSAAAGIAALTHVADHGASATAAERGESLRRQWNRVFAEEGVPWAAYGLASSTYVFTNPEGLTIDPASFDPALYPLALFEKAADHPAVPRLRLALMLEGVDLSGKVGAITSAAHTEDDIAATAEAMRRAIRMLKNEAAL
jgi:glutamate-1-semialdehyde 2,1-aminomutase